MIKVSEYVSKGHPDRLCDQIVEKIVSYVVAIDKDALCGIECAVHTNKVFIDGRIAAGTNLVIDNEKIKEIVKEVYKNAGYGSHLVHFRCNTYNISWHPFPEELEIILDLCIETLSDDERNIRKYSDDQNVVNGYALNNKDTFYLPIEHYVAKMIGEEFENHTCFAKCFIKKDENNVVDKRILEIGPDFKVLVHINDENGKYKFERLTLSCCHTIDYTYDLLFNDVKNKIDSILEKLFKNSKFSDLSYISNDRFYLNGSGDFHKAGPMGDNGLSGKKLCLDYYGPNIAIGGGAICGKDPHKVDVCGAFKARNLALKLVEELNCYSVFTTLAWSPGEEAPYLIEAYQIDEYGTKIKIDDKYIPPKDNFKIVSINNDLDLINLKRDELVMKGYMFKLWE